MALEEAAAAGVDAGELKHVRDLLEAAESKDKVEAALRAALSERNVHDLKFAIPQAKEVGLDAALIAQAEEVLKVEEPKMKAREQIAEARMRRICADRGVFGTVFPCFSMFFSPDLMMFKALRVLDEAMNQCTKASLQARSTHLGGRGFAEAAIEAGKQAGLAASELSKVEELLKKEELKA